MGKKLKNVLSKEFDLLYPIKLGIYNLNSALVRIELKSLNKILEGSYNSINVSLALQSAKKAREYFAIVKYNDAEEIKKELSDKIEKVERLHYV